LGPSVTKDLFELHIHRMANSNLTLRSWLESNPRLLARAAALFAARDRQLRHEIANAGLVLRGKNPSTSKLSGPFIDLSEAGTQEWQHSLRATLLGLEPRGRGWMDQRWSDVSAGEMLAHHYRTTGRARLSWAATREIADFAPVVDDKR
jgi:hypothetical protein